MTIGLTSNMRYFHARICFLVFALYIISASDGSKYKQDIQKINRQPEESLVERKRTRTALHHGNRLVPRENFNSGNIVLDCEDDNNYTMGAFLAKKLAKNELNWIDRALYNLEKTLLEKSIDKPINGKLEISGNLFGNRGFKLFSRKFKDNITTCLHGFKSDSLGYSQNSTEKKKIDSEVKDLDVSLIRHESSQIMGTVSSEKSETMKGANVNEFPLSLVTSKQTRLELSKSLIETNKGTNRNADITNISRTKEYESQFEKDSGRKEGHTKFQCERKMSLRDSKNSNTANKTHNGTKIEIFDNIEKYLDNKSKIDQLDDSEGLHFLQEGKAGDSVCDKKECEKTGAGSIASEKGYKIKENIKGSEDVTENDGMLKMLHHRKSRKLLYRKNMARCRNKEKDANEDVYEDEELERLSDRENSYEDEYNDKDMEDDFQNYNNVDEEFEQEDEDHGKRKRSKPANYINYEDDSYGIDEELPFIGKSRLRKKDTRISRSKSENENTPIKKNLQKMEDEKQDKEAKKTKNKTPSEEFIGNINIPDVSKNDALNATLNGNSLLNTNNVPINGANKRTSNRSHKSTKRQQFLKKLNENNENSEKIIISEPVEYKFKIQGKFKSRDSDFLNNDLPLEDNLFAQEEDLLSSGNNEKDYKPQKKKGMQNITDYKDGKKLVYENLNNDNSRMKERKNHFEKQEPKMRISDEINNKNGLKDNILEQSQGSNYSALKITDDMFKGGVEQSNLTDEKPLNRIDPLQKTAEWKVIKK